MPRRRTQTPASPAAQYARLEQRLVLLAWLHDRLGYANNGELLADTRQADEGFDAEGRSSIHVRLASRSEKMRDISPEDLARYDDNIRNHLASMNAGRSQPITLRYFQYLAALYTEIFLDWYFNRRAALLRSLNELIRRRNTNRSSNDALETDFAEADLCKLAFWMATGSGKTLIMHLNYRQYLHYNKKPLDNILLITPAEGLSQQHLDEMQASNIRAVRFDLNESGLLMNEGDVKVTEITKLVIEKTGEGESVPVEAFEGHNLIFVDEGHKGSGGDAWREVRDALGATGFTFEYSATFGQALTAAKNDALTAEYGKAIAFDYSYRYFYNDGYGKDFHILNLRDETTPDQTDMLLLANLLSFYEQQCVFGEQGELLRPYNLERPLWVFVGKSVNAVYRKNNQAQSDVLTVVRFLHRLLAESTWAIHSIGQLLQRKSGLVGPDGCDIFADKFSYLHGRDAAAVHRDVLAKVLHAPSGSGGGLHLCDIRGSGGELGLKVGGADDYFGLIYIGDTTAFKKLVAAEETGMVLEEDAISGSLFDDVNGPKTTIEVLIGARKFIEGWNSYRVSNMGLLNIGQSEGSQIIQLFGRGVRLRGRDMTLKRSAALDGRHPDHIKLLETLNIFAVRANYMAQFRDYLEREGVATEGLLELPLFIQPNVDFLDKGLVIPRVDDGRDFVADTAVMLEPEPDMRRVSIDMSARVQRLDSSEDGPMDASAGAEVLIPPESLALVDWASIHLDLLEYKARKGWGNLLVQPDAPRNILSYRSEAGALYSLIAEDALVQPRNPADLTRLQEAATSIVRKYADALYRHRREQWDAANLAYKTVDEREPNLRFNVSDADDSAVGQYMVGVPRSEIELREEVEKLIADSRELYNNEIVAGDLPCIHFDRHLYQPLLLEGVEGAEKIKISPPGLNESERQFVQDLRRYWIIEQDNALAGVEIFLLRNLSSGKGVGFYETSGFYPDFILWIKEGDAQRIVFIEPHGMLHENAYRHDAKAQLHERLPDLAANMARPNVRLDSFIISATPYADLYKRYDNGEWTVEQFAEKHILFPERDGDYMARIIGCVQN